MAQNSSPPSLEELNRRADLLAARAKHFFSGSSKLSSQRDVSGHRSCDLEKECQEISTRIKKLRGNYSELPPLPVIDDQESPLGLLLKERRIQAEVDVWKKQRPSVFSTDPSVLEEDAVGQVDEWGKELQRTLTVAREERESLTKELEREKQLLEETRLIKEALERKKDHVDCDRNDLNQSSTCTVEERLEKMEEYCSMLKESLQAFVEEHLVESSEDLPARSTSKRSKRRRNNVASKEDRLTDTATQSSLVDVIQILISKCLDSPQDPYISAETIWPPHFQLLLRSWVVERHPDNPSLVRITPYHIK